MLLKILNKFIIKLNLIKMIKILFKIFVRPNVSNMNDYKRSRRLHKLLSIYYLIIYFFSKLKIKRIKINQVECIKIFNNKKNLTNNIILYFHGGAFSAGSPFAYLNISYNLSLYTKLTCFSVNYSLAPENKFPKALNEIIDVYKSLKKKYQKSNIIIGGDSSGGSLALSAILKLKKLDIELPKVLFLICPGTDLSFSCSSIKTNYYKDYFQSPKEYCPEIYGKLIRKNYLNIGDDINNPLISPIKGDLSNMPPTIIHACDTELLYQDSVDLHKKIISHNKVAEIEIWKDLPHVWHMFNFFPQSKKALISISKFIINNIN